jgi:hypothetical protein
MITRLPKKELLSSQKGPHQLYTKLQQHQLGDIYGEVKEVMLTQINSQPVKNSFISYLIDYSKINRTTTATKATHVSKPRQALLRATCSSS